MGLVPQSMNEALHLAQTLARADVIPSNLRGKPSSIVALILRGMELGFPPLSALSAMYIVNGRVVLAAEAMVAVVRRSPVCAYFRCVESTMDRATYETLRKGYPEPTRMGFTVEEARVAGLLGKDNWRLYRPAMLRARAVSALCKSEYSDVLLGVYGPDEIPNDVQVEQASFYAAGVFDAEYSRVERSEGGGGEDPPAPRGVNPFA